MGYREKLKQYSKYGLNWTKLNAKFKNIHTDWLYKVPNIEKYSKIDDYVKEIKESNRVFKIRPLKRYEHKINRKQLI